jgi:AcrR family transcriptional regulator
LKPLKTRDRILQISLALFNQRGERVVTTNHIAAEMGISPGNLYYHFRNKTEIIKELMDTYQTETIDLLSLPTDRPLTVADKIQYFQSLSQQLWKYRFLHRDIHHLMDSNEDFKQMYPNFAGQVMQKGKQIYQGFVDAGLMKIEPSEIEALIINIWIVLTNWTNFLYMSGHISHAGVMDERWIWQGLRQMVFLEGPYLIGDSRQAYDTLLTNIGKSELFESLSAHGISNTTANSTDNKLLS